MDKKLVKYHLLARYHEWTYYTKDDSRLAAFKELLVDGFPLAIQMYFRAPAKFAGEKYNDFQNEHFGHVVGLYKAIQYQDGELVGKRKTEEKQEDLYEKSFDAARKSGSESEVIAFLKENIWSKSTLDILAICKRLHNRTINDKQASKDQKEIHKKCVAGIDGCISLLNGEQIEAEKYFYQQEAKFIFEHLCSDIIEENAANRVKKLIVSHSKDTFTVEYLEKLQYEYKLPSWVELYIDAFLSQQNNDDTEKVVASIINGPLVGRVDDTYIGRAFLKLNQQQQSCLLRNTDNQRAYYIVLKYYTERNNKPDEAIKMLKSYLDKYPESGEAIYQVWSLAENGRSMINSLPEIIETYAKRCLLNFNYHNNEAEIDNVVEALESVGKIETLFYDFSFWKEMEKCNAFVRVVESLAFSIGFDKCYDMIESNYFAAKAYRMPSLATKWLQAANSLAINNDEAQEAFVFFISNLMDENSMLDDHGKDVLMRETLDYMLKQASGNKKIAELQRNKLSSVKEEVVEDFIHHLCAPIERLEKMVMAYSDPSMPNAKEMLFMRDLVGKVRIGLELSGIQPVEDIDNWVKQNVIPYDSSKHECLEEIQQGDLVTCLSIGMKNSEKTYYEKATVKRYVGEDDNGNNV